ncbi:MAG: ABC transporter ATP-binding protein [Alphaproteobacteria bacterium]|nr:ABC transporter ATP-binding protein [Alphaproteobacteria bacterium]
MARLELRGVSKHYGAILAVEGIDLTVQDNEFFCIFGPPACGKSTLLRLLLGLETPDAGSILIDGREVTKSTPAERNLSMVFQNLALFPHLSAGDNLRFPLVERKLSAAEIERRVAAVAEKLHITPLLSKLPAHLSGGERQRVAIGRSLVRDPAAYLMDEPISALDARLREEMRVELNRLQRELKHTLVYVTHDQEEAMSVADRMCIMDHGRIAQVGPPHEIYNAPQSRYVAEFVGSPPINLIEGRCEAGRFAAGNPDFAVRIEGGAGASAAVLGVRPEDVAVARAPQPGAIAARVYEVEPLGAFTVVALKAGERVLRAQLPGQPQFALNEPTFVNFNLERCHFFDGATGRRFATGARPA